ncbi:RDD family protein [Streptomyces profundus]|uniref:RDD family protein n=1 Tax=Streptomyces profundus TaxID=2867410 RepID=UPI001D16C7AC|nr:RDD family protein [Streptomyces sp. MA3_2.13]UED85738.1 RDD family protein [Streptomyces sp. MA3_2.13]
MTVVPREAGEGWLVLTTATDVLLTLGIAVIGALTLPPESLGVVGYLLALFGCALAFSFANHVLGMCLLRASVGKLLWGLRVVRAADGGRPGPWRATLRWMAGYAFLAVMIAAEDGGGVGEACGLRTVRWRDLRHLRRYGQDGYRV